MGYTHYFTPKPATDESWDKFVKKCKKLYKALPNDIVIRGGMGSGEPMFDETLVWFNGDEATGNDHETLLIKKDDNEWSFCKTAYKPYDLLVCAVLLAAEEILGYELSSDGDANDWKPAKKFYKSI